MTLVNQSSIPPNFEKWMAEHPEFAAKKIVRENENWGKLVCEWNEQKAVKGEDGKDQLKTITHVFNATINLKTGEVYMDCRRRKIFAKQATLIFARPLLTAVKTLYHLSMYPAVKQIYNASVGKALVGAGGKVEARKKTSWKDARKKIFRNFADIVRTPAYGAALTAISVAAVALIPISKNRAYDMRALHGRVEKSLHWGKIHTNWTLGKCFQSGYKLDESDDEKFAFYHLDGNKENTDYSQINAKYDPKIQKLEQEKSVLEAQRADLKSRYDWSAFHSLDQPLADLNDKIDKLKFEKLTEKRMTNFARAMIRDRRVNYNPFYQLVGTLDPNKQYTSSNLARIGKEEKLRVLSNLKFYIDKINARFKSLKPDRTEDKEELKHLVGHLKANLELIASDISDEKTRGVREDSLSSKQRNIVEKGVKIVRKAERGKVGFEGEEPVRKALNLPRTTEVLGGPLKAEPILEKKTGGPDPRKLSALIPQEEISDMPVYEGKVAEMIMDRTTVRDLAVETFEAAFDKTVSKFAADHPEAFSKRHIKSTIKTIKQNIETEYRNRLQNMRKGDFDLGEQKTDAEIERKLEKASKKAKKSREMKSEDVFGYLSHVQLEGAMILLNKAFNNKNFDSLLKTELLKLEPITVEPKHKHHKHHKDKATAVTEEEVPRASSRLPPVVRKRVAVE